MKIEPFRIDVPEHELADLRSRIANTRWPGALEDVGWRYGVEDGYLQDLVRSWSAFDWRKHEAWLNSFPQFKATVDGVEIHFVHVRGRGPRPYPLIMTHGWPSTFMEWLDVVGPLTDPVAHGGDAADAFDVVIPSLPGYGFSEIPKRPGMTPRRIAELWVKLMQGLGYDRFAAHGCDWGAYVTALIGLDHPEQVSGVHMGLVPLSAPRAAGGAPTPEESAYAERQKVWRGREHGYVSIQSTKPQSLAYGLTDSPVGLAAWISEKWRAWTDCHGAPETAIARDRLLTNIAIYWFTRTINSANRLYYESAAAPVHLAPGQTVTVPSGFFLETATVDRRDRSPEPDATPRMGGAPRSQVERAFNVQRQFYAPHGGHFPALEVPEMFVDEVRGFFRELRA